MDVTSLVQNQWLTAQDVVNSQTKIATIVSPGQLEDQTDQKGQKYKALVIQVDLDKQQKYWKLNKYSTKKLVEKFGAETNQWLGKSVKLTTMLMQGGKTGVVPE